MDYSYYKILVWRFVRGAVATFLALVAQSFVSSFNSAVSGAVLDWSNPKKMATVFLVSLLSGFFVALSKAIRDQWGNGENKIVDKLPV